MIPAVLSKYYPNAQWAIRSKIETENEWVTHCHWLETNTVPKPTWSEIKPLVAELEAAEPMRLLRAERNRRLAETDWRFRIDQEPSQAWYEYCQALRDLPANSEPQLDENGNLTNVNWPVPPGE